MHNARPSTAAAVRISHWRKLYRSITTHNHEALNREQGSLKELPLVRHIDHATIHENYFKIKQEVEELIEHEMEVLLNTPGFN